jgi:hypothetical protein
MFILDKDGNDIGGMGAKENLKPLDTRKRFTVDFRAALLADNLIGSLHPGNGACGFSLMTMDYLASFILAVLPGKLGAWASTLTEGGKEQSIAGMKVGIVLFKVCSQYYPTQYHLLNSVL